jgi:hypothetical protein
MEIRRKRNPAQEEFSTWIFVLRSYFASPGKISPKPNANEAQIGTKRAIRPTASRHLLDWDHK